MKTYGAKVKQLVTVRHDLNAWTKMSLVAASRWNHWKLMSACRSSAERLFQSFAPAAAEHLSP